MEVLAGASALTIFILVIIFLCALPGIITGWMLKASGRSFFWGFVLGLVFGPLGFLVALIFLLIGKPPQQQQPYISPVAYQDNYELPSAVVPPRGRNPLIEVGAALVIFLCIGIIGFVAYSTYVTKQQPKLRPVTASLLPVQPVRPVSAPVSTPQASPSLQPSVQPTVAPLEETATATVATPRSSSEDNQSEALAGEAMNAHGAVVQQLPGNFEYKRETGQETGVPVFILMPKEEAMAYDAMRGSTFEAVGMLTQPERDKYGIVFFNAKGQLQLQGRREKGVLLRIDGEEIKIADFIPQEAKEVGKLKIETATVVIDQKIFEKMLKADDIFIRVGDAMYSLDQDNIDALRYYGAEVAKDLARRTKRVR